MAAPFVRLKERRAWLCIRNGDISGAKQEAEEGLAAHPGNAALEGILAEILRREGRTADARALALDILDRHGPHHVAASVLGKIHKEKRAFSTALELFQEAYHLHPTAYYAELMIDCLEEEKNRRGAAAYPGRAGQVSRPPFLS